MGLIKLKFGAFFLTKDKLICTTFLQELYRFSKYIKKCMKHNIEASVPKIAEVEHCVKLFGEKRTPNMRPIEDF